MVFSPSKEMSTRIRCKYGVLQKSFIFVQIFVAIINCGRFRMKDIHNKERVRVTDNFVNIVFIFKAYLIHP